MPLNSLHVLYIIDRRLDWDKSSENPGTHATPTSHCIKPDLGRNKAVTACYRISTRSERSSGKVNVETCQESLIECRCLYKRHVKVKHPHEIVRFRGQNPPTFQIHHLLTITVRLRDSACLDCPPRCRRSAP